METEDQLKRWTEHVRKLLNRPSPEAPSDIPPVETELSINCNKLSKAEIRKVIMSLKNENAAGPDEIPTKPSNFIWRHPSTCCTAFSVISGKMDKCGRLKGRNHHQAAEEGRSERMQQLPTVHAFINARQSPKQSYSGENEGGSGRQASIPAGRFQTKQILC